MTSLCQVECQTLTRSVDSIVVYVVVEEDQNDWIDGGVGPGEEREELVDLGRLLELRIDEGKNVERVPGEDEEYCDEDRDSSMAQGLTRTMK